MSRFNGGASGQQLWSAPISPTQSRQAAQQENEAAWRRSQQLSDQELQQQYDEPGRGRFESEPVDYDIYNKAVAVSSPRLAGINGDIDPQATIRKTVIRRVEVPFTRSVQVPTQVVKLVPTTVEQKVPVKKLVQCQGYQTVNESYIEYEDREAIREKEIWVKKVVPEKYIERVPVQRVRQVQKPTSVIREVEVFETVQVPTTRRVVVDGFRVDEVPDSKVVEVEEEQTFQMRPEPVGPNEIKSTRDLGRLANSFSNLPDAPYGSQGSGTTLAQSGYYQNQSQQGQGPAAFGSSQGFNRSAPRSAAPAFNAAPVNPLEALRGYGLGVDETHTRHTDGTGVVVTRIDRGGHAARAGLQVSDIVTAVQGRPTTTVSEFIQLLQRAPGPVTLHVNRDGRRNISLVFSAK
jgi:hypothetical protein